jgi:hypothetical protein
MRAQLNFVRPMASEPLLDVTGATPGNLRLEVHDVELADADAEAPGPSLASHGFCAVPFKAALPHEEVDGAYRRQFANLCVEAVRRATGAALVIGPPIGVQLRNSQKVTGQEGALSVVHGDFTPRLAAQRSAQFLAQMPGAGRFQRFAAFNTWWPGVAGPYDWPLALCDAGSIAASDIQIGRARALAPDRTPMDYGEVALQRYNPRQRWYWYSGLGPDRVLIFCGFDSDPAHPSMVTHSAFANPECPAGAAPRVSVESRCFAFW